MYPARASWAGEAARTSSGGCRGWGRYKLFFWETIIDPAPGGGEWRMEEEGGIGDWLVDGAVLCSIGGFPPAGSNRCSTSIIAQNRRLCTMIIVNLYQIREILMLGNA